ncbi:AAA family ATPase [Nocardia sp. NPDC051832]|uniref:AAA family ATPase n=1 Tax=Nocardia sp. NPDC051832 TaxID=3155673 RepID=UPI0034443598
MSADSEVFRPVTVAVMGTHSTGKTTFINKLAGRLRRDRIEVEIVADLGSLALEAGLPILAEHTWASTLWIIARGISTELEAWTRADVVLIDRGAPDALGYYEAALETRNHPADPRHLKHLEEIVVGHSRHYDYVLRTVLNPEEPLGLSKPRDTDLEFRALADQHIEAVLQRLGIGHDTLTSDGHDRALVDATAFIKGRLADSTTELDWGDETPKVGDTQAS